MRRPSSRTLPPSLSAELISLIARSFAAGEMSGPLTRGKLMVKNYYRHNVHVRFLLKSTTDFEFLSAFKQLGYPVSGLPYKYCYKT